MFLFLTSSLYVFHNQIETNSPLSPRCNHPRFRLTISISTSLALPDRGSKLGITSKSTQEWLTTAYNYTSVLNKSLDPEVLLWHF